MTLRLCFFGDSFVNGVGDEDGLGWPGRIVARTRRKGIDITSHELGIRGNTSADVLARWELEAMARLVPHTPAGLAFSFGANDCADDGSGVARISHAEALANANSILVRAVDLAPTLFVGPAPILDDPAADARIETLDLALDELCKALHVPYLSVFGFLAECDAWIEGAARQDGTHSDAAGYAALAGKIATWAPFKDWVSQPASHHQQ